MQKLSPKRLEDNRFCLNWWVFFFFPVVNKNYISTINGPIATLWKSPWSLSAVGKIMYNVHNVFKIMYFSWQLYISKINSIKMSTKTNSNVSVQKMCGFAAPAGVESQKKVSSKRYFIFCLLFLLNLFTWSKWLNFSLRCFSFDFFQTGTQSVMNTYDTSQLENVLKLHQGHSQNTICTKWCQKLTDCYCHSFTFRARAQKQHEPVEWMALFFSIC